MTYTPHDVLKAEKIFQGLIGMVGSKTVLPALFARENFDKYKGAQGDVVNVKVRGALPWRRYAFRNDRSQPIVFDTFKETSVQIGVADHIYSAAKLTEEQQEFDLIKWAEVMDLMSSAVALGLEQNMVAAMLNAAFPVTIGNAEQDLYGAVLEARRVMNRLNQPAANRLFLVGDDFEAAMLSDDRLTKALNVGDSRAEDAVGEATIGRLLGFNVVRVSDLGPEEAIATTRDGFVLAQAAPVPPQSAPLKGTVNAGGFGLRYVRDYDMLHMEERAFVDTWCGTRPVHDFLTGYDSANNIALISEDPHFLRAIKVKLDGSSDYPAASSELAELTGLSDAAVWTPTGPKAETDPANA